MTYNSLINVAGKMSKPDTEKAVQLLHEMRSVGISPSEITARTETTR